MGRLNVRFELFVNNMERSTAFYRDVFGLAVEKSSPDYTSLVGDGVRIGLGVIENLPREGGYGFTQESVMKGKGAGVEIVIETEDLRGCLSSCERNSVRIVAPIRRQEWGLEDFRVLDPDGYYLRITSFP